MERVGLGQYVVCPVPHWLLPPDPVDDGSTEEAGGSANSGCYADDMGPPALNSAEPLLVVIEGPPYHLFEIAEIIPMLCHERLEPCQALSYCIRHCLRPPSGRPNPAGVEFPAHGPCPALCAP